MIGTVREVIPTSEARLQISATIRRFRNEGEAADPVIFGSHRRPEAVMLPYQVYEQLLARLEDLEIALQVQRRVADAGDTRLTLAETLERAGLSHLAD